MAKKASWVTSAAAAMCLAASIAHATGADAASVNSRSQALAQELRCVVCQNQSLADSNAELAVDLRRQIRQQIEAGRSDQEVVAWMRERYGDFILYRPPWRMQTILLWLGPLLLLLAAAGMAWRHARSRQAAGAEQQAPDEQARRRAAALLDKEAP